MGSHGTGAPSLRVRRVEADYAEVVSCLQQQHRRQLVRLQAEWQTAGNVRVTELSAPPQAAANAEATSAATATGPAQWVSCSNPELYCKYRILGCLFTLFLT